MIHTIRVEVSTTKTGQIDTVAALGAFQVELSKLEAKTAPVVATFAKEAIAAAVAAVYDQAGTDCLNLPVVVETASSYLYASPRQWCHAKTAVLAWIKNPSHGYGFSVKTRQGCKMVCRP